jgi:hypothetical protein
VEIHLSDAIRQRYGGVLAVRVYLNGLAYPVRLDHNAVVRQ